MSQELLHELNYFQILRNNSIKFVKLSVVINYGIAVLHDIFRVVSVTVIFLCKWQSGNHGEHWKHFSLVLFVVETVLIRPRWFQVLLKFSNKNLAYFRMELPVSGDNFSTSWFWHLYCIRIFLLPLLLHILSLEKGLVFH